MRSAAHPKLTAIRKSPTTLLTLPLPAPGPKSPTPQSHASSLLNTTTEHESAANSHTVYAGYPTEISRAAARDGAPGEPRRLENTEAVGRASLGFKVIS